MKARSARNQTATLRDSLRPRLMALAVASCFATAPAWSMPSGPQVVAGSASFSQSGNTLSITNVPGTIINWQSFSVSPLETTRFLQQNNLSAILNRVTGPDASQILGALQSNGRVYLINPNGIAFGPGARVDTQGLIASTLNISDKDFLAGKLNFEAGAVAGGIRNEGVLQTPRGGSIYLVASDIENAGIIHSPGGEVILAAGGSVQLVEAGHPDIQVVVSAPENKAVNLGQIVTEAGRTSLFGAVLQQKGRVSADAVETDEFGRIVFRASKRLELDSGSSTSADGLNRGGEVIMQGGDALIAKGTISTQASAPDGKGGFVDTSARWLDINQAKVNVGKGGTWLIDPYDIEIVAAVAQYGGLESYGGATVNYGGDSLTQILASTIVGQLDGGANVVIDTAYAPGGGTNAGSDAGNITVSSAIASVPTGSNQYLTLKANNNIVVNADITSTGNPLAINLIADQDSNGAGSITVAGSVSLVANNANVTFSAAQGIAIGANAKVSTVNIADSGGGQSDLSLTANAYGGTTGDFLLNSGARLLTGRDALVKGSNITIAGQIERRSGYVGQSAANLLADQDVLLTGAIRDYSEQGMDVALNSRVQDGATGAIKVSGVGSAIKTYGGDIKMVGGSSGTGAAVGHGGVLLDGVYISGATLDSGGGNITLKGTGTAGTSEANGVFVDGSSLSSAGGTVSITGTGGAGTTFNDGVDISTSSSITTTTGGISVFGTSGAGSGVSNHGVNINNTTTLSTGNGAISIVGYGAGVGGQSAGIQVGVGSMVTSSGTGAVSLAGYGGSSNSSPGINIMSSSTVRGTNGNLTVSGYASNTGSGGMDGVRIQNGVGAETFVGSLGTGTVTILGVGGSGGGGGVDVYTTNSYGDIKISSASVAASISIDGTSNSGSAGVSISIGDHAASGVLSSAGAPISLGGTSSTGNGLFLDNNYGGAAWILGGSNAGDLTLKAGSGSGDAISIDTNITVSGAAASKIILEPMSTSTNVSLGLGASGGFALSDIELADISGFGTWRIGTSNGSNGLNLAGDVNAGTAKLHLKAGSGGVTQTQDKIITAGGLAVSSLGNVVLNNFSGGGSGHAVTTLAAEVGDNSNQENHFYFTAANGLTVGEVDTLTAANGYGGISIAIGAGNYTAGTDDGVIMLKTLGTSAPPIAQTANGLLSGRAVYLSATGTGGTITLTEANPTGIVAATAYGGIAYSSANDIFLTTIDTFGNGITSTNGGAITLSSGGNIVQDAGYGGLTTTGNVSLAAVGSVIDISNAINAFSGDLYAVASGVATGGVKVKNTAAITVNSAVRAYGGGVWLDNGANSVSLGASGVVQGIGDGVAVLADSVSLGGASALIKAGAGDVMLMTDNLSIGSGTVESTAGGVHILPRSSGKEIEINTGACTAGRLCLQSADIDSASIVAGELAMGYDNTGNASPFPSVTLPASGSIYINDAINRGAGDLYLMSGGIISQLGAAPGAITADALGARGTSVSLWHSTGNLVNTFLAESTGGSITMLNGQALTVGTVTPFGDVTPIGGVHAYGGGITVQTSTGNLIVNAPISIQGTNGGMLNLVAGNGTTTIGAALTTSGSTLDGGISISGSGGVNINSSVTADGAEGYVSVSSSAGNIQVTAPVYASGTTGYASLVASSGAITVNGTSGRVAGDTTVTLNAGAGSINLSSTSGSGVIHGVTGVSLTATGATSDIIANPSSSLVLADTTTGNISFLAGRDIKLGTNANGSYADIFASTSGTVTLDAVRDILVDNFTYVWSGSGNVTLAAGRDLTIRSSVNSTPSWVWVNGSSNLYLTATTGSISVPAVGSGEFGGHVSTGAGGTLYATAATGISLTNSSNAVSKFSADNGSGNIVLNNTASPLTVMQITNDSGNVTIDNTGEVVIADTSCDCYDDIYAPLGSVSITAHSPLTLNALATIYGGTGVALTAGNDGLLTLASTSGITSGGSVVLTGGTVSNSASIENTSSNPLTPTITQTAAPTAPTLAQCTADPTISGCSTVLPSLTTCTTAPTTAGCSAVLPTLASCEATPTLAGCSAVLPSLATCTTAPTTAGCTAVLPTVESCATTPTLAGCTAVLPTVESCTTTPTLAGCTAVLPTLASCTTTPTLAGCTAVLPTVESCTTTPTLAGCTAVLPTVESCTTTPTPTLAGCTAVLPTVESCTTTPTLAGCTAVLPTLASCATTPTLAGCTAVLPTVESCTTTPTLAGCTAVLPTLASCTTTPTLAGCTAVLPTVASCTTTPTLAGCSAVLPTLASCAATPTLAGCSAVLPSLAICTTAPTTAGCSAVLPTVDSCVTNPTLAGCSAVLPTLASCATTPTLAGCSVVLPSLDTCTTAPTTAGCSAVLPSLASCTANASLPGCSVVLPSSDQSTAEQLACLTSASGCSGGSSTDGGTSSDDTVKTVVNQIEQAEQTITKETNISSTQPQQLASTSGGGGGAPLGTSNGGGGGEKSSTSKADSSGEGQPSGQKKEEDKDDKDKKKSEQTGGASGKKQESSNAKTYCN
nr:filamentous hemagglutinin N-terminal domain-containing protein [Denitratisoma oestradiolicum]